MIKGEKPVEKDKPARNIFAGIRGVVEGYSRRTLIIIIAVNLLLAGGVVGGVRYYLAHKNPPVVQLDPENSYAKAIMRLEKQPVPKDPFERAIYYSQIAQNYETLDYYQQALDFFLKAQEVVDEHKLSDSITFYSSIADQFIALKDRKRAKEYYQKELHRLNNYKTRHPEDAVTANDAIKEIQKKSNGL